MPIIDLTKLASYKHYKHGWILIARGRDVDGNQIFIKTVFLELNPFNISIETTKVSDITDNGLVTDYDPAEIDKMKRTIIEVLGINILSFNMLRGARSMDDALDITKDYVREHITEQKEV